MVKTIKIKDTTYIELSKVEGASYNEKIKRLLEVTSKVTNRLPENVQSKPEVTPTEILKDIQQKVDNMHTLMIPKEPEEMFTHEDMEDYMFNDLNKLKFTKADEFETTAKQLIDTYENKEAAKYIIKEAKRLKEEYNKDKEDNGGTPPTP